MASGVEVAMTRRELLDGATAALRAAGIPEPRHEAMRIWCDLSGESLADAFTRSGRGVEPPAVVAFQSSVGRRVAGEPLAHVCGWAGFRRLLLRSDRRALIPRPETEGLVDLLLERVRAGRVADIGTGTGCLALSLATEGDFSTVLGVDRSAEALSLARENRALTGGAVQWMRGDLVTGLRPGSFDALISNPPYLSTAEYAGLDPEVRDWEPRAALHGGTDGLAATDRLLADGLAVLRPGGWIAVEVDSTRADGCARRATARGWTDVTVHKDLFGRERYLLARRSDAA
ncbi:MAG: peptide chain release factor N(5)-glutamine methyltransferase [Gemmatimonadales bacterium]